MNYTKPRHDLLRSAIQRLVIEAAEITAERQWVMWLKSYWRSLPSDCVDFCRVDVSMPRELRLHSNDVVFADVLQQFLIRLRPTVRRLSHQHTPLLCYPTFVFIGVLLGGRLIMNLGALVGVCNHFLWTKKSPNVMNGFCWIVWRAKSRNFLLSTTADQSICQGHL